MCNLHTQALVYIVMSNTAIRKSNATPIRATTSTNVERRQEKKAWQFRFFRIQFSVSFKTDFQFLSKSIFEMLLFPSFYAKKCVHGRFFLLCMTCHKCRNLTFSDPDQRYLPNNIKRQHPSTP